MCHTPGYVGVDSVFIICTLRQAPHLASGRARPNDFTISAGLKVGPACRGGPPPAPNDQESSAFMRRLFFLTSKRWNFCSRLAMTREEKPESRSTMPKLQQRPFSIKMFLPDGDPD